MSYCRHTGKDSEAYIVATSHADRPAIVCYGCRIQGKTRRGWYRDFIAKTPAEMLAHAHEHNKRGVPVPQRAIERLEREVGG